MCRTKSTCACLSEDFILGGEGVGAVRSRIIKTLLGTNSLKTPARMQFKSYGRRRGRFACKWPLMDPAANTVCVRWTRREERRFLFVSRNEYVSIPPVPRAVYCKIFICGRNFFFLLFSTERTTNERRLPFVYSPTYILLLLLYYT